MAKTILSDWEKRLNKNINAIKRAERNLRNMGLKIGIAKNVETMMGCSVDNVYIMDYAGDKIILQKHLFTVYGK